VSKGRWAPGCARAHQRGARSGFAGAWPCQVGVFTNLSLDHLDLHGSAEHYLASKAQLFVQLPSLGAAVLNACDPASKLLDEVTPRGVRRLTYAVPGRGRRVLEPNLAATSIAIDRRGTRAELTARGLPGPWPRELVLRAIGDIYVENALAALLAAVALGANPADAARRIEAAEPPPGRFEIVAERPLVAIDYAHSPDALRRTLGAARALGRGALHLVIGAGGGPTKSKREPLGEAARAADRVTLTSDNPRDDDPAELVRDVSVGLGDHPNVDVELDRKLAIEQALTRASPDDLVLIAGKGHEREQVVRGVVTRLSDAEIVRAWLARRPRL